MKTLPQGWAKTTLGELTSPTRPRCSPQGFPDLPFIGMEHIEAHSMKLLGVVRSAEMKSAAVHFQPGEVLYGRLRPYLNKVFRPDFEGLCSAEFIVLPGSPAIEAKYLQYLLNCADFVQFASHLNTGDRPRVDFLQIADFPVVLPPLPEQHRIVTLIEEQLSRLDAAVAELERVRARLPRYRAAVLKAACEGRLFLEPWLSPAHALDKSNGPPTQHWAIRPLREITELRGGLTLGQKRSPGERVREVPYLRVANVQRGYLDLTHVKMVAATEAEISALALRHGDVLFNEGGDRDKLGRGWIWNGELPLCIHQNHVFRARIRDSLIHPKLLSWYGNSIGQTYFMGEGRQTTNLASINLRKLGALPVPIPPKSEQRAIVEEVERRLSVEEALARTVGTSLTRTERFRHSILRRAFAGELVPQDPTDEPAEKLLERIRAERPSVSPARTGKRARACRNA